MYNLFNSAVSHNLKHRTGGRGFMDNEKERIWKEDVLT
jgi:hypothetical protein